MDVVDNGQIKRSSTTIIPDHYFNKWNKMESGELRKELNTLDDRIYICTNEKILAQLLEIKTMLERYMEAKKI